MMNSPVGIRAVVFFAIVLFPAVVSLAWPLGPDQAIMMTVAQTWLHGSSPYVGAIDTKGPFAYVPFFLASIPGGGYAFAVRVVDLCLIGATCAWLYRELRGLVRESAAWWSATVLAALFIRIGFQDAAQPDGWVALCAAPLLIRAFRSERIGARLAILIGALAGVGALVKPFYAVILSVPALMLVFRASPSLSGSERSGLLNRVRNAPWRGAVTLSAWAVLGFAIAVVPMVLLFAARHALDAMGRVYFGPFVSAYYAFSARLTAGELLRGVLSFYVLRSFGLALSVVALAGWLVLRRERNGLAWLLVVWFTIAFGLVALQRRFFGYHWLITVPPTCIAAGYGLAQLGERVNARGERIARSWRALASVGAIALLVVLVARPLRDVRAALFSPPSGTSMFGAITRQSPRAGLTAGADRVLRMRDSMIARGLRGRGVVSWVYDPSVILLAGAHSVAPIIAISPSYLGADAFATRTREDIGARLVAAKPPYVVIDCWLVWDGSGAADPAKATTFNSELARWYSLVVDADGLRLLQRVPAGQSPAAATPPCARATASAGAA